MENDTDYQNFFEDLQQTTSGVSSSLWSAGLGVGLDLARSLTIQLSSGIAAAPSAVGSPAHSSALASSPNNANLSLPLSAWKFINGTTSGETSNWAETSEIGYPNLSSVSSSASSSVSGFDPAFLYTTIGVGAESGHGDGIIATNPTRNESSSGYLDNLAVAVPMGVGLYALSLLTFVGNAMVLHAIRTERRLQTVSNMFIMSLAIADLTVGMIVMPISSAYVITGDWKFGVIVCQFWLSADYTASTASILNLLILSLDRYWSIRSPLKYLRKRTKKRALIMIGVVWLVSAMWIIPIIGWHYWYNDGVRKHPSNECETEFADNILFKLTASTANFYVPMVLMICLYVKIFYEIKKRSKFEIGQCNVGGTGSVEGTLYAESSERNEDGCGSCRSSSNGSSSNRITAAEGGRSGQQVGLAKVSCNDGDRHSAGNGASHVVTRRYVRTGRIQEDAFSDCTGGECYATELVPERTRVVKSASADSRFQHLTLVAVRSPEHDKEPGRAIYQQDFENVTINVEYVLETAEEKESVVIVDNRGVTVRPHRRSFNGAAHHKDKCQRKNAGEPPPLAQSAGKRSRGSHLYHHRSHKKCSSSTSRKKFGSGSHGRKSDRIPMGELTSADGSTTSTCLQQPTSVLPTEEMMQARLSEQQLQCRQSSGLLPNLTTALKMRVTRKGFHSNLRQEKKAARQLGVIMGAFVLCWLPYIIIFIVTAYCKDCINSHFHTATIWLGYVNSAMNPFLYALCNANFKRAFRKMFRRGGKKAPFCPPNTSTKTDHLFA